MSSRRSILRPHEETVPLFHKTNLVGPTPEDPGGGGLSRDEAFGALGQRGLIKGLAEGLGGDAGGRGGSLESALQHLFAGHFLFLRRNEEGWG